MTETWLDVAIPRWGPPEKQGYGPVTERDLSDIKGEIKHSMVGGFLGAWGEMANMALKPNGSFQVPKSFTFSILKSGVTYQHYPLEAIAWTAGSFGANLAYISEEHEGGPPGNESEPLTTLQYQATLQLTQAIRQVLPHLGPPDRAMNLREHNEFAPTACPSGRIPWARLITDLREDGMTPEERARLVAVEAILAANGITADYRLADSVRAIETTLGDILRLAEGQSQAWVALRKRWFKET